MKIALVRKEFNALHGGAERYAVNLANGLAELGHDVHIFCGKSEMKEKNNITVHKVSYLKTPSPLKNLSFSRNSAKLIAKESFDIVNGLAQIFPQDIYRVGDPLHINCLQAFSPNPVKRGIKYLNPRHLALLYIEKNIFKQGNYKRIITNSRMSKAQVAHYYNVPEEKITVVHNGVDLNKFNPDEKQGLRQSIRKNLGIKNDESVLLFAGNDFRRKGLQFAMQCAANLIKKGLKVKLLIAGRQKAGPYLRLVRKNGYADNFLFLGHVEKIEYVFCASDMFVLPTFYDPFSNVCLEAMACGLPVMTTRLNGAAEIIEDRVSGILVDSPWDLEEMITAASSVIENNSSGLKEMSKKAVLAARQNPVEKNIQEIEKVYMEVMKEKGVC